MNTSPLAQYAVDHSRRSQSTPNSSGQYVNGKQKSLILTRNLPAETPPPTPPVTLDRTNLKRVIAAYCAPSPAVPPLRFTEIHGIGVTSTAARAPPRGPKLNCASSAN